MTVALDAPESMEIGQVVEVRLTLPQRVAGFQWTLETTGLEFTGVSSDDIMISDQHVGLLQNGVITMSWNEADLSKELNQEPITLTLRFVATQSGKVSDKISLSDKVTAAEAYTATDEIMDVRLGSGEVGQGKAFALYQNEPNPWTGSTTISFELPEEGHVKLTLVDMTGKTIKVIEGQYKAGHQTIQLLKKDVPAQGLLYYRLDSGNYSATKKMIRLE
jgi:hypothetical protein